MWNHGCVSRVSHTMENSSAMRVSIANASPLMRADFALLLRQPPDQDRDEDDVVDAEDDLERGQRDEGEPRLRVGEQLHHGHGR